MKANRPRSPPGLGPDKFVGAAAPVVVYAVGDSTVAGLGGTTGSYVDRIYRRLRGEGLDLRLMNLSKSGATTEDVLKGQATRMGSSPNPASGSRPDGNESAAPAGAALVVVGVGINDLVRRIPLEVFRRHYDALITQIQGRVRAPIVVSNIPELSLVPAVAVEARPQVAARVQLYNAAIEHVAHEHGVAVFDMEDLTRRDLPAHPEYISADGFHPSDSGYEAWAQGMWPVVRQLVPASRAPRPLSGGAPLTK